MYWTLNELGYRTYHTVEALMDGDRGIKLMEESYDAKYIEGRPYGRKEFDKWYGEYDVSLKRGKDELEVAKIDGHDFAGHFRYPRVFLP